MGTHSVECDICNEEMGEDFIDWNEAVEAKKENGWKSKKIGNEWKDICPDCQELQG
jgi:hypothetical protein